jgi:uncharacterized protein (TIGR02594 family)
VSEIVMPELVVTARLPAPELWMRVAEAERKRKVEEVPGKGSNPRIEEYLFAVGMEPDDEISWCSAFVDWVFDQVGIEGTGRANARSWLSWGEPSEARRGAVCVLWREDPKGWKGHVGFYEKHTAGGDMVQLLGGNQGNRVCSAAYDDARVLGYRWPKGL